MHISTRTIFHVDMDAFFAAIEQRDNPALCGKPVVVGALPGNRGVVSASSYEARRFGIRSAMPISEAYRRCPTANFVLPRMDRYSEESASIMEILESFSPVIEQISVDEAFIDMSGTQRLFGEPIKAATSISNAIVKQRNLTASIGIGPNKFIAKIASDLNKPNGITIAPNDQQRIETWLAPLPVGRIWGVGTKTQEVFHKLGIMIIGDLQQLDESFLNERFGEHGASLWYLSRGIDNRPVGNDDQVKSISREHTFDKDCNNIELIQSTILTLSRDIAFRARNQGMSASTITITWRTPTFHRYTRRTTLATPTDITEIVYKTAISLFKPIIEQEKVFRLVGVGLSNLHSGNEQTDLFDELHGVSRKKASEAAVDKVTHRFGKGSVHLGGEFLRKKVMTNFAYRQKKS